MDKTDCKRTFLEPRIPRIVLLSWRRFLARVTATYTKFFSSSPCSSKDIQEGFKRSGGELITYQHSGYFFHAVDMLKLVFRLILFTTYAKLFQHEDNNLLEFLLKFKLF